MPLVTSSFCPPLTTTLVAAQPAPRALAAKGTTRAPSGALSLQPTIPVIPANLNMRGMAQSGVPASAELRMSAATFTPGEKEHKTPIKTISAAAADEDAELCAWLQQKASLTQRVVDKVLPKLHDEDVYDVNGLLVLRSIDGLSGVFSRVVAAQVADALDALGSLSIAEQEPMSGGLTTPTRATQVQRCLDSASTTTTTTAYAAPVGAVETASPSVQTPRTQMGGDGGSLEEKVEQAAPPKITSWHVQGVAPNHQTEQQPGPASQRPSPYSAAEPPLVGAPAFSSPPAARRSEQFQAWQHARRQQRPWKLPLGPKPDAKLPHDQRYGESGWLALETYDSWLRGDPIMSCVFEKDFGKPGAFEEECDIESPDEPRLCEACKLSSILGRALSEPDYYNPLGHFLGHFDPALDRFVFRLIDARCGIESQLAAFSKCGYEVPPRTAELKDLMLQAARRDHERSSAGWTGPGPGRSATTTPPGSTPSSRRSAAGRARRGALTTLTATAATTMATSCPTNHDEYGQNLPDSTPRLFHESVLWLQQRFS